MIEEIYHSKIENYMNAQRCKSPIKINSVNGANYIYIKCMITGHLT